MIKNKIKLLQLLCFLWAGDLSNCAQPVPYAVINMTSRHSTLNGDFDTLIERLKQHNFAPCEVQKSCNEAQRFISALDETWKAEYVIATNKKNFIYYINRVGKELKKHYESSAVEQVISCFESIYVSLNAGLYKNPEEVLGSFEGLVEDMRSDPVCSPLHFISTLTKDADEALWELKGVDFDPDKIGKTCDQLSGMIENLSDVAKIQYAIATNKEKDFVPYIHLIASQLESDDELRKEGVQKLVSVFESQHRLINELLYQHIEKRIPHEVFQAFEDLAKNEPNAVANFLEVCTVEKMAKALEAIRGLGYMGNYYRKQVPIATEPVEINNPRLIARFKDLYAISMGNPHLYKAMISILGYYWIALYSSNLQVCFDQVVRTLETHDFATDKVGPICKKFIHTINGLSNEEKMQYAIETNKNKKNVYRYIDECVWDLKRAYKSRTDDIIHVRLCFEIMYELINKPLFENIKEDIPHEVFQAFEGLAKNEPNAVANFLEVCTVEKMAKALEAIRRLGSTRAYYAASQHKRQRQMPVSANIISDTDLKNRFESFNTRLTGNDDLRRAMRDILVYYNL